MLYVQLVPRLRMAQRFTGSGLKIATDIAGILVIRKAPARPSRSFSLATVEIDDGSASAMEPMEKIPHRGDHIQPCSAER